MNKENGLIIRSTGSWYEIRKENGTIVQGRMRGKLKLKGFKVTNPISVGDYVVFQKEEKNETVVITKILPRKNYIIRQSPKRKYFGHIIASNLDQACIIVTMAQPRTSTGFIDRFLVVAESFRIPALIIFNKDDILTDDDRVHQDNIRKIYENIGYKTITISALEKQGIDDLKKILEGKKSLLTGHSGVGKSTVVNAISPTIEQKTQEVSEATGKGLHTTTFSEMFEINTQTYIIDTPGIRELGIMDIKDGELSQYFPEINSRRTHCKYNNCTHIHEPQCKVKEALNDGYIAPSRYDSYITIISHYDSRG